MTRTKASKRASTGTGAIQRLPAEALFADELVQLRELDEQAGTPRPPGWELSMESVRRFVMGDEALGLSPKFVGDASLVDRAMVTLATSRGLMLVGEPGTAKSLLSELLAAAISGVSTLTIQGGASLTEDQIRHSWNYALLVAKGPSLDALVPSPLYRGMQQGKIVRFEEITRCPIEVQDALLSMLSERVMAIPELGSAEESMLYAREGFNLIATANTRDRGVNEMSAALKRRFNFETVFPIADFQTELALVRRETDRLLAASGVPVRPPEDLLHVLVTAFRELRMGESVEGYGMERLSSALSTAEAVSVAHAVGVRGYYLRGDAGRAGDILQHLAGTAAKDNPEDLKRLRVYIEQRVKDRKGDDWQALYDARHELRG